MIFALISLSFTVNAQTKPNDREFVKISNTNIMNGGDLCPSTQTLQIAAYDGTAWGNWKNFTLTTTGPACKVGVDLTILLKRRTTRHRLDFILFKN